jgi:hypothetical protein
MNDTIKRLALQADAWCDQNCFEHPFYNVQWERKFAELIVYDFLSELTNDDALGEARIATIRRLAEKWGVAK